MNNIIAVNAVASTAPHTMGMPNSICNAIALPSISANDVEMLAHTAVQRIGRLTHAGVCFVAASLRQRPVAMPRWATLCCNIISITVDRVTTQSKA